MSTTTPSPLWCVCRAVRVLMERRSVQTIPALPLLLIVSKLTFSQTKGTWRIDCWWSGYRDELVSVALVFVFEQGLCVCVLHVNSLQSKVILIVFEDVRRRWKRSRSLSSSLSLSFYLHISQHWHVLAAALGSLSRILHKGLSALNLATKCNSKYVNVM